MSAASMNVCEVEAQTARRASGTDAELLEVLSLALSATSAGAVVDRFGNGVAQERLVLVPAPARGAVCGDDHRGAAPHRITIRLRQGRLYHFHDEIPADAAGHVHSVEGVKRWQSVRQTGMQAEKIPLAIDELDECVGGAATVGVAESQRAAERKPLDLEVVIECVQAERVDREKCGVVGQQPPSAERLYPRVADAVRIGGIEILLCGQNRPQEIPERDVDRCEVVQRAHAELEELPRGPRRLAAERIGQ